MDGFENVIGAEVVRPGKVGNSPGYLQNTIVGAGRKIELLHGLLEEHGAPGADHAMLAHDLGSHIGVGSHFGDSLEAIELE